VRLCQRFGLCQRFLKRYVGAVSVSSIIPNKFTPRTRFVSSFTSSYASQLASYPNTSWSGPFPFLINWMSLPKTFTLVLSSSNVILSMVTCLQLSLFSIRSSTPVTILLLILCIYLLYGFCDRHQIHKAMHFYNDIILKKRFQLDHECYLVLINGLCKIGETHVAIQLLRRALQIDRERDHTLRPTVL